MFLFYGSEKQQQSNVSVELKKSGTEWQCNERYKESFGSGCTLTFMHIL